MSERYILGTLLVVTKVGAHNSVSYEIGDIVVVTGHGNYFKDLYKVRKLTWNEEFSVVEGEYKLLEREDEITSI